MPVIPKYSVITTKEDLDTLVKVCFEAKIVAVDAETTGLDPWSCRPVGYSFSWAEGVAAYVPFGHTTGESQLPEDVVVEALRPLFKGEGLELLCHNKKFDLVMSEKQGIPIQAKHCTMIQAYLTGKYEQLGTQGYVRSGLKYCVSNEFNIHMATIEDILQGRESFADVPINVGAPYTCADADMTRRLHFRFWPQVKDNPLYAVEMGLVPATLELERTGFPVDQEKLHREGERLKGELETLARVIYRQAYAVASVKGNASDIDHLTKTVSFDIGSPAKAGHVLFNLCKLPVLMRSKKTKAPSTSATALERLRKYPLVSNILSYRSVQRHISFLGTLGEFVYPDGRIHCDYLQAHVGTGRYASKDPNMQQVSDETVWIIPGVKDRPNYEIRSNIKDCIIAPPGFEIDEYDLSQIELRVLAGESQDASMLKTLSLDPEEFPLEGDIHKQTAADIWQLPILQITSAQRRDAKVFVFGIPYGMGPEGVAARLGTTKENGTIIWNNYMGKHPAIPPYRERTIRDARSRTWVKTHFGRIRFIPELLQEGAPWGVIAKGERAAVNTIIQGTAADIAKIILYRIYRHLLPRYPGRLFLMAFTHDSYAFLRHKSIPVEEVFAVMRVLADLKIAGYPPIFIDCKAGPTWGRLEKVRRTKESSSPKSVELKEDGRRDGGSTMESRKSLLEPRPDASKTSLPPKRIEIVIKAKGLTSHEVVSLKKFLGENPGNNQLVIKVQDRVLGSMRSGIDRSFEAALSNIVDCEVYEKVDIDDIVTELFA